MGGNNNPGDVLTVTVHSILTKGVRRFTYAIFSFPKKNPVNRIYCIHFIDEERKV